jgi:hypothetical protein
LRVRILDVSGEDLMIDCMIVWLIASLAFGLGWSMGAGIVRNELRAIEEKHDEIRKDRIRDRGDF